MLEAIKTKRLQKTTIPGCLPALHKVQQVWSPNSKFVLMESLGRSNIWDAHTEEVVLIENQLAYPAGAVWSDDSTLLFEYQRDHASVLDVHAKKRKIYWQEEGANDIRTAAWSPVSKMILVATYEDACIRDAQTARVIRRLQGIHATNSVAWSQDSRLVLTASPREVCVWDFQTGALKIHVNRFYTDGIAWTRDLNWILARSFDRKACIYNTQTRAVKWTLDQVDAIDECAWSPNSHLVAARCDANQKICVWDVQTGKKTSTLTDAKQFKEFMWSSDSKLLHTKSGDNSVRSWNPQTGQMNNSVQLALDYPLSQALSYDSQFIVTKVNDTTLRVQDMQTGKIQQDLVYTKNPHVEDLAKNVVWSPDGKFLVGCVEGWHAMQWNVELVTNEEARQEEKALKENVDPEKYRLLHVLDFYIPMAISKYCKALDSSSPTGRREALDFLTTLQLVPLVPHGWRNKTALLAGAVALSQQEFPGYSVSEAIQSLMKFNPAWVTSILKMHEIHRDEIALHLAKTILFEKRTGAVQAESPSVLLESDDVKKELHEFVWGVVADGSLQKSLLQTPAEKQRMETHLKFKEEDDARKRKIDLAKQWEEEKGKTILALFQAIDQCDLENVKKNWNPVTALSRNPDAKSGNFRTPLMEVIWRSGKKECNYDAIFNELLTVREYVRDEYHREVRSSDLAAQDFNGRTPLLLAIDLARFDYALKIAHIMNQESPLHDVFKNIDREGRTAYAIALEKREKHKNDDNFIRLFNILVIHHKDIKLRKKNIFF